MSMKLITEVTEQIKVLTEDAKTGKNYFIEGIFLQGAVQNRNGRVYPPDVLQKEVDRYSRQYVREGRAFGELGHPDGPAINLERVSHMIKELHPDGNNYVGKAKIMDTPYGKIVKNLIDEGAKLGVSSRGMGSLREVNGVQHVQDDFYLATAADIVADPSAPDAFVRGIMEGKEWVWNNGVLEEKVIAGYKARLDKSSVRVTNLEETELGIWSNFLSNLSKNRTS